MKSYVSPNYFAESYFSPNYWGGVTPVPSLGGYYAPEYFAGTYFTPNYFPEGISRPEPTVPGVRDWDVLQAFMRLIKATNAFDSVHASDLPDMMGRAAKSSSLAIVGRVRGSEREDGWDDPTESQWARKVTWSLTILARHADPLTRDRKAERLLNIAKRAVNADVCIEGVTIIGRTHVYEDMDLPAVPPTRTIRATGEFTYLINGPDGYGIEE